MADVNIIANRMFCYAQMNQYTLTTEQNLYVDNDMNVLCSMIVPMISTGFGVTINADAMKCNCSMPTPAITTRNLLAIRKTFTLAAKNLSFTG